MHQTNVKHYKRTALLPRLSQDGQCHSNALMSDAESAQWRLLCQTRRKTSLSQLDMVTTR